MSQARNDIRQHAIFLLLSVALHAALLLAIRIPENHRGTETPFTVRLVASPTPAHKPPATLKPPHRTSAMTGLGAATPIITSPQHATSAAPALAESSLSFAQHEAVTTEQQNIAAEKQRLATPAGQLEQYMRMPHKEILLANGVRKIVTEHGEMCFQPVPYFARDQAGLFGIPMTCP